MDLNNNNNTNNNKNKIMVSRNNALDLFEPL